MNIIGRIFSSHTHAVSILPDVFVSGFSRLFRSHTHEAGLVSGRFVRVFRRFLATALSLSLWVGLCGFTFYGKTLKINTDECRVYEYLEADELFKAIRENKDDAKKKYNNGYFLLAGRVKDPDENGKDFALISAGTEDREVKCSFKKEFRENVLSSLTHDERTGNERNPAGADVAVYGRISFDLLGNDIKLEGQGVRDVPADGGTHYLLDGSTANISLMTERTIDDSNVTFRIPAEWEKVEHKLPDEKRGTIDGYQYVLNDLDGGKVPESFFVCYFNYSKRLDDPGMDSGKTEDIEDAIVDNISGEDVNGNFGGWISNKTYKTYYGADYDYYFSYYKESNNRYKTEFIFQPVWKDGLVMYLYLYDQGNKKNHLSDIMFVTRLLETGAEE